MPYKCVSLSVVDIISRLKVRTVLDIGCNQGNWAVQLRGTIASENVLCIDGNSAHEQSIRDKGYEFVCACLSNDKKLVKYYSSPNDGFSTGRSYYLETTQHFSDKSYEELETISLDEVLGERNFDMIKMDIQGCEYDALCGAKETVKHAKCFILETSTGHYEYNKGSPSQEMVVEKMREYGFIPLFSIEDHPYSGGMSHQDILFILPEYTQQFIDLI